MDIFCSILLGFGILAGVDDARLPVGGAVAAAGLDVDSIEDQA